MDVTPEQLEALADLSEEYADGVSHVTTRQDFQFHYVHIDDTPALMRRLAAVGITTREACGNSVRNVTACPLAGICRDEQFDVTPYAKSCSKFLMGHPDTQDFGRKVKVAFSGCQQHPCGLVTMHDMGAVAQTRVIDGEEKRGFDFYVGGGLGSVPYKAKLFDEFLPEEELLPIAQAISRVFARLGEKSNRARARLKFLIANLGIDEFRRMVLEERQKLDRDPRWTDYLASVNEPMEEPLKSGVNVARPVIGPMASSLVHHQRLPTKTAGIRCRDRHIAAGRRQRRSVARAGRHRAPFRRDNLRTTVNKTFFSAGSAKRIFLSSTRRSRPSDSARRTPATIVDVTACPERTPANWGSPLRADWRANCASRLGEKSRSSMRR